MNFFGGNFWNRLSPIRKIPDFSKTISRYNCIVSIQVGFWVRTSFSRFPKFNFNVIFCNFRKVRNRRISEISVNLECSETPVFDPKTLKNRVFWPKNRKLFPNLFPNYFCEFKKTGYFQKISELWKPNYSETRKNEKFGKFRLLQGLRIMSVLVILAITPFSKIWTKKCTTQMTNKARWLFSSCFWPLLNQA